MKIGDIIIPHVNRFPGVDPKGQPIEIDDDFLGRPAVVTKLGRCSVEVWSLETGKCWVYRPDEVAFYCSKEEWKAKFDGAIIGQLPHN